MGQGEAGLWKEATFLAWVPGYLSFEIGNLGVAGLGENHGEFKSGMCLRCIEAPVLSGWEVKGRWALELELQGQIWAGV